jgi:hypothetical protein
MCLKNKVGRSEELRRHSLPEALSKEELKEEIQRLIQDEYQIVRDDPLIGCAVNLDFVKQRATVELTPESLKLLYAAVHGIGKNGFDLPPAEAARLIDYLILVRFRLTKLPHVADSERSLLRDCEAHLVKLAASFTDGEPEKLDGVVIKGIRWVQDAFHCPVNSEDPNDRGPTGQAFIVPSHWLRESTTRSHV